MTIPAPKYISPLPEMRTHTKRIYIYKHCTKYDTMSMTTHILVHVQPLTVVLSFATCLRYHPERVDCMEGGGVGSATFLFAVKVFPKRNFFKLHHYFHSMEDPQLPSTSLPPTSTHSRCYGIQVLSSTCFTPFYCLSRGYGPHAYLATKSITVNGFVCNILNFSYQTWQLFQTVLLKARRAENAIAQAFRRT